MRNIRSRLESLEQAAIGAMGPRRAHYVFIEPDGDADAAKAKYLSETPDAGPDDLVVVLSWIKPDPC